MAKNPHPLKHVLEGTVMKDVIEYLDLRNIYWINIKNTGTYDAKRGTYRNSPYMKKGVSDLLVIYKSKAYFMELKRPVGGVVSPDQILFKKDMELEGMEYHIVKGVDDIEKILH